MKKKEVKKKTLLASAPAKKNCGTSPAKKTPKRTAAKKPVLKAKKVAKKRVAATAVARPKTSAARSSARRTPAKTIKKDIFTGATEVALTDNKIVVTRLQSKNVKGKFEKREVREYHDKTPANMNALNRKLSSDPMKKVSVKFK